MSAVNRDAARDQLGGAAATSQAQQALLPIYLYVDPHTSRESREQQLLWKLGGSSVQPGMVVKAFCQQQHIQQPQQLEREVQRLQGDLQTLLKQHKDLEGPVAPALVKLDVKVPLLHLESLFLDEPLWDLSAPRAACEAYVAAICNELGLDWQSHTMIMRRMKDAIDAAAKDLAAGKAQVVPPVSGAQMYCSPPSKLPQVRQMNAKQSQHLQQLKDHTRRSEPDSPHPVPASEKVKHAVDAEVKSETPAEPLSDNVEESDMPDA